MLRICSILCLIYIPFFIYPVSIKSFTGAISLDISLTSSDSPWGVDHFSYKNLWAGGPRFHVIGTWSSCQKNLFSTISYLCQNFIWHMITLRVLARFRIVTRRYSASFSQKLNLCEANNIFYSQGNYISDKMNDILWKYIKNKCNVSLDSFCNFAYVSTYLCLKSFAWKRGYVISQELQMPQTSLKPF